MVTQIICIVDLQKYGVCFGTKTLHNGFAVATRNTVTLSGTTGNFRSLLGLSVGNISMITYIISGDRRQLKGGSASLSSEVNEIMLIG